MMARGDSHYPATPLQRKGSIGFGISSKSGSVGLAARQRWRRRVRPTFWGAGRRGDGALTDPGGRRRRGRAARIVGSGLWRKKVGSEGLWRAEAAWGTSCICREARVSDPNQDRRLARVGLLGSRAGLGPLAQTTEAWIYQVFFCPENKAVFFVLCCQL
jgi:hypothetical protein